jgi:ferredoxin-NADP reductase
MSTAANSPGHMLKLNSRREVAEGTIAFEFDKPSGFVFKAGQFAEITWVDPVETDSEGNARAFSIASAPHEENLLFTTRLRDTLEERVQIERLASHLDEYLQHSNRQLIHF